MKTITLSELENFCDAPELSGPVIPTLIPVSGRGFKLTVQAGQERRRIVTKNGRPFHFFSVESALRTLVDISNLSRHILIDINNFDPITFNYE